MSSQLDSLSRLLDSYFTGQPFFKSRVSTAYVAALMERRILHIKNTNCLCLQVPLCGLDKLSVISGNFLILLLRISVGILN